MNKHKKFIKDAYEGKLGLTMCEKWKSKIEEAYPELKEEEIPQNGWLYCHTDLVMNHSRQAEAIKGKLYFCEYGNFTDESGDKYHGISRNPKRWFRKATREEIEKHLIEEAQRRGLDKNGFIKVAGQDHIVKISGINGFHYNSADDILLFSNWPVYSHGDWADPVNTITKEEAEKKLNCKIVD